MSTSTPDQIRTLASNPDYPSLKKISPHLLDTLADYLEKGTPGGHFVMYLLSGDMVKALNRADIENAREFKNIVSVLYNFFPAKSWGSPGNVERWQMKTDPRHAPFSPVTHEGVLRRAGRVVEDFFSDDDHGPVTEDLADELAAKVIDEVDVYKLIVNDPEYFEEVRFPGQERGLSLLQMISDSLRSDIVEHIAPMIEAHQEADLESAGPTI